MIRLPMLRWPMIHGRLSEAWAQPRPVTAVGTVDVDVAVRQVAGPDGGLAACPGRCRSRSRLPCPSYARQPASRRSRESPRPPWPSRRRRHRSTVCRDPPARPDLPTAMTMRPQLASSPAIAVFTSGEFATVIAIRLADLALAAPVTSMLHSLSARPRRPDHLQRQIQQHVVQRPGKVGQHPVARGIAVGGRNSRMLRLPGGDQQHGVRGGRIGIHRRAIEAGVDALPQHRLQRIRGDLRVGENEAQHRRHIRRDHAAALGDPGDPHRARRRSAPSASPPLGTCPSS